MACLGTCMFSVSDHPLLHLTLHSGTQAPQTDSVLADRQDSSARSSLYMI